MTAPAKAAAPEARRITLVFRLDDVSAKSDTLLEARLVQAFRQRGQRCTFGVIPRIAAGSVADPAPQEGIPLPSEKITMLRDAIRDGTVEPAEHGLSHQAAPLHAGNALVALLTGHDSEFFGVSRARQEREISRGRRILQRTLGIPVDTFIPPWNAYDWNTLSVLKELGFRCLSAARVGPVLPGAGLKLLPCTCGAAGLREAVETARKTVDPSPVVVVLLHPGDFAAAGAQGGRLDLGAFEKLLDWVSAQPDVRVDTLDGAARILADLGSRRFSWNRISALRDRAASVLDAGIGRGRGTVYLGTSAARSCGIRTVLLTLAAGLAIILLTAGMARWLP